MAAKAIVGGTIGDALMMIGILCAMGFLFGGYALLKGWMDAKKQIHLQFEAGKMDDNYQWEYRFYDDGYEVIGKNEKSRVKYDNVGRLIDMSGMYVIVERGNVVRYFMKDDAVQEIPRNLQVSSRKNVIFRWNSSRYDRRCRMEPIYAVRSTYDEDMFYHQVVASNRG